MPERKDEVDSEMKQENKSTRSRSRGEDGSDQPRKKRKNKGLNFHLYIHTVLKQVHPDMKISNKAMAVLNSFVFDMFERLASEATKVSKMKRSGSQSGRTLDGRAMAAACKLILPGELGKLALKEADTACNKYKASIQGGKMRKPRVK